MYLEHIWLRDFRSYQEAEMTPAPSGITLVSGPNGEGKTNLLEAISYLATARSFRGSPTEALVRDQSPAGAAVLRATGSREGRTLRVEAELRSAGRDRIRVNGQALRRSRDLHEAFHVTVFTPDDLTLVKGGPQARRDYLDGLLQSLHPRHHDTISEVERVLRQRNSLLKTAGGGYSRPGSPPGEIASTLDAWDAKLASAGEALSRARSELSAALQELAAGFYRRLARSTTRPGRTSVTLAYAPSWQGSLLDALRAARRDDLRRAITTTGPHRDDLQLSIGRLPARTHASQGEQRSLALALRLAGHDLVAEHIGSSPIMLLDDVFSELDAARSAALLDCLPDAQAVLTTAAGAPGDARVGARFRLEDGKLLQ